MVDYIPHFAYFSTGRFKLKRWMWVVLVVALAWFTLNFVPPFSDLLTDSATRAAYDIERAAGKLQSSSAQTYTLVHHPKASPEGCSHDYTFQLSQQSSLLVWCKSPSGDKNVASHTTTYHLRYVDAPEKTVLSKRAGEPVTMELQKTAGKPAITRAY